MIGVLRLRHYSGVGYREAQHDEGMVVNGGERRR